MEPDVTSQKRKYSSAVTLDISNRRIAQNLLDAPNIQVDLNYMTHQQVGRVRKNLFSKKVQYQNQLMTLKEKGKRLVMCQHIEEHELATKGQIVEKDAEFGKVLRRRTTLMKLSANEEDQRDVELKRQMDQMGALISHFENHTRHHQEENTYMNRKKLRRDLESCKVFSEKTKCIDNKIEYDQRYFNRNYAEFQLMISDLRK